VKKLSDFFGGAANFGRNDKTFFFIENNLISAKIGKVSRNYTHTTGLCCVSSDRKLKHEKKEA